MTPEQQPAWMRGLIYTLFALGLMQVIYSFTGAFAPYGIYYPAANLLLIILMFAALAGLMSNGKMGTMAIPCFCCFKAGS